MQPDTPQNLQVVIITGASDGIGAEMARQLAQRHGAGVGLVLRARGQLREGRYVPFGPFLALAAMLLVACGPSEVLHWIGLA